MEQKEPSMEEILSSIRRILSTEEEGTAVNEELKSSVSEQPLSNITPSPDEEQVMDLTQDMLVDDKNSEEVSSVPDDMVLLSEATLQASADKLSALNRALSEPKAMPQKLPSASGELENLVSALLRPYLKDWLAENLPSLVEKVVQKEVEKLVNKARQE